MTLTDGIKINDSLLKACVKYVNDCWETSYKVEDIVGIELGLTYMFVHFNKADYTKDAYPVKIELVFI